MLRLDDGHSDKERQVRDPVKELNVLLDWAFGTKRFKLTAPNAKDNERGFQGAPEDGVGRREEWGG